MTILRKTNHKNNDLLKENKTHKQLLYYGKQSTKTMASQHKKINDLLKENKTQQQ